MKEKMLKSRINKGFCGGFTLSELLICVAIVAVLALIAIPVLGKQLESGREEADISNLRSAKSAASHLLLTGDAVTGPMYFDASNGSLIESPEEIAVYGQGTETDGGCESFVIVSPADGETKTVYTSESDAQGKIIKVTFDNDSFEMEWEEAGSGGNTASLLPDYPETPYISVSGSVPVGGFYYKLSNETGATDTYYGKAIVYKKGNTLPAPATGDVYEYGQYVYMFNKKYTEYTNGLPAASPILIETNDENMDGWSLMTNKRGFGSSNSNIGIANDTSGLSQYNTPLSSIAGKDVVNADYLFYGNSNLTQAPPLPLRIRSTKNAFCDCTSLVTCEYELPAVSDKMFKNCKLLTGVVITSRIDSIGTNAFYGCKAIESIYIPDSVTTIKASPFASCSIDIVLNMGHSGPQPGFNSKWNKLDGKNTETSFIRNINWNYGK